MTDAEVMRVRAGQLRRMADELEAWAMMLVAAKVTVPASSKHASHFPTADNMPRDVYDIRNET